MTQIAVTFTISEFCLYSGVSQEELYEIVGLGLVEPARTNITPWEFDDRALSQVNRAQRLRRELELDWPGIALALSLLDENERLRTENRVLQQRLARFTYKL